MTKVRMALVVGFTALLLLFPAATAAHAQSFGGSTFGPNGGMGPAGFDFGQVRLGKSKTVSMIARGKTCIEIDKTKPNCAGLVIATGLIEANLRATGDFKVVAPRAGCRFPALSPDGAQCPFRVRFKPTKRGARTGLVWSNGYGRIELRGGGTKKKPPGPPPSGPGIPIDGGCCPTPQLQERVSLTWTGPDPVELHVFDELQRRAWAGAPNGIPNGVFSATAQSFFDTVPYTQTLFYFGCLRTDTQPGDAVANTTIRDPDGTTRMVGPTLLDGSGDQEFIGSSPPGAGAPPFAVPPLCS